jgi:hypothetical protein
MVSEAATGEAANFKESKHSEINNTIIGNPFDAPTQMSLDSG